MDECKMTTEKVRMVEEKRDKENCTALRPRAVKTLSSKDERNQRPLTVWGEEV
jgi:hypothetical protein